MVWKKPLRFPRADHRPGGMEFGNWALTEDSSEAYRATYVLLVSAILLPVILFARRGCMTVALVLLLASIVHQVSRLHVDTSYWGHIAAGVGLCRASHYILHGDGGALVIRVQHASLGLIATLAMFSYVVFRLPLHTFYNKVHATIWALASLLFASMAAHPITARACNGALPRVAAARQLHDPAVLAALGTLLYTHLHDMQPIGMLFHQAPLAFLVLEGGEGPGLVPQLLVPHACRTLICVCAVYGCVELRGLPALMRHHCVCAWRSLPCYPTSPPPDRSLACSWARSR